MRRPSAKSGRSLSCDVGRVFNQVQEPCQTAACLPNNGTLAVHDGTSMKWHISAKGNPPATPWIRIVAGADAGALNWAAEWPGVVWCRHTAGVVHIFYMAAAISTRRQIYDHGGRGSHR